MLTAGLIAIGISGAACQALGWSMGDHVLAQDAQSAHLSTARCADLAEYYPATPTCAAAELAHHADEIVSYRLAAGALGIAVAASLIILSRVSRLTDDEAREQRRRYVFTATMLFGVATAFLLAVGFDRLATAGDSAPRWFADGGVAAAFFTAHALLLRGGGAVGRARGHLLGSTAVGV